MARLLLLLALPLLASAGGWFKTYSTAPYKEYWTMSLEVRKLDKSLPDVLKVFTAAKASLVAPFNNLVSSKNPPTQQLRYKMSLAAAKRAAAKLKKLGSLSQPQIRPAIDAPPMAEVQEKLAKLGDEKKAHAAELSSMPSVAALVDEALEHLRLVAKAQQPGDSDVLLNMTLSEAPPKP